MATEAAPTSPASAADAAEKAAAAAVAPAVEDAKGAAVGDSEAKKGEEAAGGGVGEGEFGGREASLASADEKVATLAAAAAAAGVGELGAAEAGVELGAKDEIDARPDVVAAAAAVDTKSAAARGESLSLEASEAKTEVELGKEGAAPSVPAAEETEAAAASSLPSGHETPEAKAEVELGEGGAPPEGPAAEEAAVAVASLPSGEETPEAKAEVELGEGGEKDATLEAAAAEDELAKKEASLPSQDEEPASLEVPEAKTAEEAAAPLGDEGDNELGEKAEVSASQGEVGMEEALSGASAAEPAPAVDAANEEETKVAVQEAKHELVSDEKLVVSEPVQSISVANRDDTCQNGGEGHAEKLTSACADEVFDESTENGQNAESDIVSSEAAKDMDVEKYTDARSVRVEGANAVLSREVDSVPPADEETKEQEKDGAQAVVEQLKDNLLASSVVEKEEKAGGNGEIVHAGDDDEDDGGGNEAAEEEDGVSSDRSPARVAILDSSEAAKQIMKELEEGSSSGSAMSGLGGSREYTNSMDGQIMLDDSDEEEDDEDDDGDDKGFDSAALAALLKAASGASADENIRVTSQDGSRIFSIDRPAGLGSSVPSLRPTAPRTSARSNLFSPSELAVAADPEDELTEEEKELHDKVELIRVKFLRLVYRLGHSPEETVAAQVLYRLSLAEGIRRGRQTNRAFSLENARKKALQLEAEGKEDLNFSCNILVLGKTGVGKSATINSIFGEEKSKTDPFEAATTDVREIVGNVEGVQIRIIDTPGLRANVMDQGSNRRILSAVKKYTKKCPPDIVLYVDRLDSQSRDLNDLPLLRTITAALGSSIWFNAIIALTHAASAPPDGPNGSPLAYEVFVAQRSHIVQQSIRQAAGDMRLMNPVALAENHPSCRRNRENQKVLPNGQSWKHQMLLLCYSSKILSEANVLLKLQDPSPGKLFGFRFRSPPLPFLLSSLLQSRAHPKLSADQGGEEGDSDVDLDDYSDVEQDDDEEEYDQLPPFKPLTKSQLEKLTKQQKNAYFDEYDYRVKLLQKKQWKDELRRLKEMKKRGKVEQDAYGYGNMAGESDLDPPPENVSVPLPDMVLPPSFDCDNPTYRYRFLEPTSTILARPVLDTHGWDHDCGYDGVSLEETLAVVGKFPAAVSVQVTKDKKEFSIHLDSSVSAKHGENASSLAGFDVQTVGRQLAYVLRGETKIKNIKKNKTTGGFSVTFLGDIVATGVKVEDQLSVGKRLALVASTGAMRAQGETAYGANLEARLKDKDYPIGQSLSTLGLSLMKWRGDLALGANLQSQFSVGRGSKMALRLGLNNKLSGQITVRTSTSEQVQIALLALLPVAVNIYKSFRPSEPSFTY